MKEVLTVFLVMFLSGCVDSGVTKTKISGLLTAQRLNERYNSVTEECPPFYPGTAYLCSGVLLRTTDTSKPWNPVPAEKGVAFSFLRRDSKYGTLYSGNNGIIFYSRQDAPRDKIHISISCFFPRDAASSVRENDGCGQSAGIPTSAECRSLGVITADQWIAHYNKYGSYSDMCGFDVRDVLGEHARTDFMTVLKAQALIKQPWEYNEILMPQWSQDIGGVLPLQAFFYLKDNDAGKKKARENQITFETETGIALPIVSLSLPSTPQEDASFSFDRNDQAIKFDD
ncbi:hypothetical protein [Pseudomonas sp. TWR1-1-4]|uniref:hypothetical protein n=1 Tax=Pseudomonas sp. TWR1-1-4 TaxID=2804604 RepID=UPI003CF1F427